MTLIPKECKRLAEVDFPIAAVSRHSATRRGLPSTLHLWWARRPLAACRAMLMALLLPDSCDEHCPAEFKRDARRALSGFSGRPTRWNDQLKTDEGLREILLEFIADFAIWDNAAKPAYLNTARALIIAAHPDETPLVVDPFAGGGSLPLEALRIGCDAFASDLNPVACLILKVLLEDIPRHGTGLADELRIAALGIKAAMDKELVDFYPRDADGATPMVYLWARTISCEAPSCGAEIPLMRSFWLSKRTSRKCALRYEVQHGGAQGTETHFKLFEPTRDSDVPHGSVSRAKATCLCCGSVVAPDRVRAQLSEQIGGADVIFDDNGTRIGGARMLAVVTRRPGESGRHYRLPTDDDYVAVWRAQQHLTKLLNGWDQNGKQGLCPVPNEQMDVRGIRHTWVMTYGVTQWGQLFNAREHCFLVSLTRHIARPELSDSVRRLLTLVLDRLVMLMSAHCRWKPSGESLIDMFGRHAIGMVWDYAEASPEQTNGHLIESWATAIATFIEDYVRAVAGPGQVALTDAAHIPLPSDSVAVWFTDPPYYDSIAYAHLADCFYVWMKRALDGLLDSNVTDGSVIDKEDECVVDRPHRLSDSQKDRDYFEAKVADCAAEGRRVLTDCGIGCVVFAHKTTEGWESLISGFVRSGWAITASWPIATELSTRLNARDTASLATSVHLVCRPRPEDAPVGDWGEVLRELPRRVEAWMDRLQDEGVRGADLVFACIGPALEIFSRYSKVETAEGKTVPLADYLEKVWEVVGRTALNQVLGTAEGKARNGAAGALEEDARLTALFLWTMQATEIEARNGNGANGEEDDDDTEDDADDDEESVSGRPSKSKGFSLIFDVARRFALPLGIHLEAWEDRIIKTEKGVVRLIPVLDRGKQLFGEEGAGAIADRLERSPATAAAAQMVLFPEPAAVPKVKGRGRGRRAKADVSDSDFETRREATTLDRVHASMLLQASGRANALRALLKAEVDRGPDFLRLANALSALYPQGSDEKRLLDAMLLAIPR